MLPGINFSEILIIGVVALVVIGPRDLPKLARMAAGYIRQARGLARDFQKSFDEMGRQLELDELKKEVEALRRGEPFKEVTNELKGLERDLKSATPDPSTFPTSRPTGPAQIPQSRPGVTATPASATQSSSVPASSVPASSVPASSVSEPAAPQAQTSVSDPAPPAQRPPTADEPAEASPAQERKIGGL